MPPVRPPFGRRSHSRTGADRQRAEKRSGRGRAWRRCRRSHQRQQWGRGGCRCGSHHGGARRVWGGQRIVVWLAAPLRLRLSAVHVRQGQPDSDLRSLCPRDDAPLDKSGTTGKRKPRLECGQRSVTATATAATARARPRAASTRVGASSTISTSTRRYCIDRYISERATALHTQRAPTAASRVGARATA